jgi:DNA-directed RNA polymerase subunit beta
MNVPSDVTVLRREDVMEAVKYLVNLRDGVPEYSVDDIDHLGNGESDRLGN